MQYKAENRSTKKVDKAENPPKVCLTSEWWIDLLIDAGAEFKIFLVFLEWNLRAWLEKEEEKKE